MRRICGAVVTTLLVGIAVAGHATSYVQYHDFDHFPPVVESVEELLPLAEQGDAEAQYRLGILYFRGEVVQQNDGLSADWFERAAVQGHSAAGWAIARWRDFYSEGYESRCCMPLRPYAMRPRPFPEPIREAFDKAEFARAFAALRRKAKQGNADAQFRYASVIPHARAWRVPWWFYFVNLDEIRWYRRAAEQGHAGAQWQLGMAYRYHHRLSRDEIQSEKWLLRAAEQGHGGAQHELAMLYHMPYTGAIPKNWGRAAEWAHKAADQGHARAQLLLSLLYYSGEGVPRDHAESSKWRRRAYDLRRAIDPQQALMLWEPNAYAGNPEAQYQLALLHFAGRTVPRDREAGTSWMRRAAEGGHADAQYRVGKNQDASHALYWYRRAAEQGHIEAQQALVLLYCGEDAMHPEDFEQIMDYLEAYKWTEILIGQAQEHMTTRRGMLEEVMTPEQVAEAKKRAREWQPVQERADGTPAPLPE